jgi:hypothetical protein
LYFVPDFNLFNRIYLYIYRDKKVVGSLCVFRALAYIRNAALLLLESIRTGILQNLISEILPDI